jgi:hypothetical protein
LDLSKLVDYEAEFPVKWLHPKTKEFLGVTFYLRSMASKDIKKIDRVGRNEMLIANEQSSGGSFTISPEALDVAVKMEREKLISAIVRWDWGGNSFGNIGKDPECTYENKAYVLDHDAADTFLNDLMMGADGIANFIQEPAPNV